MAMVLVAIALGEKGTVICNNPFSILASALESWNLFATLYPKLKERFAIPE